MRPRFTGLVPSGGKSARPVRPSVGICGSGVEAEGVDDGDEVGGVEGRRGRGEDGSAATASGTWSGDGGTGSTGAYCSQRTSATTAASSAPPPTSAQRDFI